MSFPAFAASDKTLEPSAAGDHHASQMKAIQVIRHPISMLRNRSLFLVATDVEVRCPAVGQPVDQPRVAMETKNDCLSLVKSES